MLLELRLTFTHKANKYKIEHSNTHYYIFNSERNLSKQMDNNYFNCLFETPNSLAFRIEQNEKTANLLQILRADPAFYFCPSSHKNRFDIRVEISKLKQDRAYYSTSTIIGDELSKFKFSAVAKSELIKIRKERKGNPSGQKVDGTINRTINTEFKFLTLHDWIMDGRLRCKRSISIKTKRDEARKLKMQRKKLINEKQKLLLRLIEEHQESKL